ncbi:hypothetical protein J6590_028144 [Homalodisca vitripennis]|nr:hypothetical protein J6590_028144 [Homalodisca vitripennis]
MCQQTRRDDEVIDDCSNTMSNGIGNVPARISKRRTRERCASKLAETMRSSMIVVTRCLTPSALRQQGSPNEGSTF